MLPVLTHRLLLLLMVTLDQNHREVDKMGKGASGAVRVDDAHGGSTLTYGRQFSADSGSLYSSITRETINALKAHFREQVRWYDRLGGMFMYGTVLIYFQQIVSGFGMKK